MIIRLLINVALWLLGMSLIVASGGGAGVEPGEGGETRRFDQYPVLLEIAGNGVVVAGQRGALNLIADATQFRRNSDLNSDQTYGADLRLDSSAIEIFDPRPVLVHRTDGSDFYDSKIDIAGAANVANVQRVGLRASNPRSAVSRIIFVVPAGRSYLASLTMSQSVVQSGSAVEAVLTLSQPAPAAGARVTLQDDSPTLTIPADVTIPAGATEARFQVSGTIDSLQRYVIVTATYDGVEQQAGLWVRALEPFLLDLDIPERLTDGNTEPARVRVKAILSAPAVAGRMVLRLQSNNSLVTFPDALPTLNGGLAVIVPGAQLEVPFDVQVAPLFELGSVRVTAELIRDTGRGSSSVNQLVADSFFGASQIAELRSVSFSQFLANGNGIFSDNCIDTYRGAYSEVSITLSQPAPRDYRMEMYASNPSVLQLNRVFTIPEGQSEVRFRMDHVAGGPPETCTQVGPFCTSIGNYQRPDADMHRFTRIIVRALRTGKTITFDRWVTFRNFPTQPVIDPFILDAAALRGGQTITGNFGVVTNNHYDDLPIAISVGNGPTSQYVWRAQFRANDRLDFALPTAVTDDPTTVAVVARSPIQCLGGSSDDPGQPAPSVRRSINLLPGGYLAAMSLDKPSIFGGDTAQLTVQLNRPAAAGGLNVVLTDDFPSSPLQFPSAVFVAEGSDRAVVNVSSQVVPRFTQRIIRAAAEGVERVVNITLLPEPAGISLAVTPSAVVGGQIATIRVIADQAYPVPLPTSLVSTSAAAPVPASVTLNPIGSGPSEASYAVTTLAVAVSTTVTLTAQLRGQSASAQLRIDPPGGNSTLRNLTVGFAPGSAAGTVTSNPGSINCTPSSGLCANSFQDATSVTLTAVPATDTSLTSNAGCDSFVPAVGATPAQCQVTMINDRVVSFGFTSTTPLTPTITQQPQSVAVAIGATGTFSVVATAAGPLSYRWQRGGVDIPGATAATYTTPAATSADDGAVFRVIVTNSAGSTTSQGAVLTVGRGWRQLGAAIATPGFDPTLAVDSSGVRYVSYTQAVTGSQKLFVKKFEGGAWVPLGADAVNAATNESARDNTLIIGPNNLPVLGWYESTGVQVARWTGAQWEKIGTDRFVSRPPDGSPRSVQLARVGTDVIAAWIEFVAHPAPQLRIAVQRYDATMGTWSGGFVPNVTNAKFIRLAVDSAGFPTVAYVPDRGVAGDGAVQVVRQSATGWAALGGDVGPVPVANSAGLVANYGFDIKFDGAGAPIVFGSADGLNLFGFRYIANAWQSTVPGRSDGVFLVPTPATEATSLMAFTRGGPEITIAYSIPRRQTNGGLEFLTEFLNWSGNGWIPVGESLRFFGRTLSPALVSGTPIFAAQANSLTNEVVVQEFVP